MLLVCFFFFRFEWESFQKRLFLKRGNSKSDNSLKRLRIELKSKRTIEKTTRHWGKSFLLQNIKTSAKMSINVFPIQTFVNSNKPV